MDITRSLRLLEALTDAEELMELRRWAALASGSNKAALATGSYKAKQ